MPSAPSRELSSLLAIVASQLVLILVRIPATEHDGLADEADRSVSIVAIAVFALRGGCSASGEGDPERPVTNRRLEQQCYAKIRPIFFTELLPRKCLATSFSIPDNRGLTEAIQAARSSSDSPLMEAMSARLDHGSIWSKDALASRSLTCWKAIAVGQRVSRYRPSKDRRTRAPI